jgi:hypothetical protein
MTSKVSIVLEIEYRTLLSVIVGIEKPPPESSVVAWSCNKSETMIKNFRFIRKVITPCKVNRDISFSLLFIQIENKSETPTYSPFMSSCILASLLIKITVLSKERHLHFLEIHIFWLLIEIIL